MFNVSCQSLDSNPGPLLLEATALSTAPQPLPKISTYVIKIRSSLWLVQ